jgi:hypothetical protein
MNKCLDFRVFEKGQFDIAPSSHANPACLEHIRPDLEQKVLVITVKFHDGPGALNPPKREGFPANPERRASAMHALLNLRQFQSAFA